MDLSVQLRNSNWFQIKKKTVNVNFNLNQTLDL